MSLEIIFELTGCEINTEPDVFHLGLLDHKDDVLNICNAVQQEAKNIAQLREIEADWQTTEFAFASIKINSIKLF